MNPADTAASFQLKSYRASERESATIGGVWIDARKKPQVGIVSTFGSFDRTPGADHLIDRVHTGMVGNVGVDYPVLELFQVVCLDASNFHVGYVQVDADVREQFDIVRFASEVLYEHCERIPVVEGIRRTGFELQRDRPISARTAPRIVDRFADIQQAAAEGLNLRLTLCLENEVDVSPMMPSAANFLATTTATEIKAAILALGASPRCRSAFADSNCWRIHSSIKGRFSSRARISVLAEAPAAPAPKVNI